MNATIVMALLVAAIGPNIIALATTRIHRRDRRCEWKAQDRLNKKLDVIHVLVNSNMTAAMQSELDATVRELALMREVLALKQHNGYPPFPEMVAAIEATEARITELRAQLTDRLKDAKVTVYPKPEVQPTPPPEPAEPEPAEPEPVEPEPEPAGAKQVKEKTAPIKKKPAKKKTAKAATLNPADEPG